MSMKTKGVAFNLDDPDQKALYEYATTRTNFSAYVKRLIQADMQRQQMKAAGRIPAAHSAEYGGIKIRIGEKSLGE
ncbi:hypothetical protein PK21_gp42 [Geobacillus phage vB_GthS_PK2.1]|nr:hypothetical protein PK21_gp42 [Geobacillus phage vB_GthS_PK2.1]